MADVPDITMGAIIWRRDAPGSECWRLEEAGKRRQTRLVSAIEVPDAEIARFRRTHELPVMPQFGQERTLLLPAIERDKALSHGALRLVLEQVFACSGGSNALTQLAKDVNSGARRRRRIR